MCNGETISCPTDRYLENRTLCRDTEGPCDVADYCDGMTSSCLNTVAAVQTVCRAATGDCDATDYCNGVSIECLDVMMPRETVCRPASGPCDIVETCTGNTAACPQDGYQLQGVICRNSTADCDAQEVCSGTNSMCPNDVSSCTPTEGKESLFTNEKANLLLPQKFQLIVAVVTTSESKLASFLRDLEQLPDCA